MDGLSAVGSAVSLATFVGQLLQSTKDLYEFWSSVRDLPKHLQWLIDDLTLIQCILEDIKQQDTQGSTTCRTTHVCQALQRCAFYLAEVEALVAPMRPRSIDGKKKRIIRSIKGLFEAEKVRLYRENLEAAKQTLLIAQNSSIQASVFKIRYDLAGVVKMLAGQSNAVNNVSVNQENFGTPLSSLPHSTRSRATATLSGQRVSTPRTGRRPIYWKHLHTPIGDVSVRWDAVYGSGPAETLGDKDGIVEFRLTFVPRRLLFRKATSVTGIWDPLTQRSLTSLNIQFRPVVDSDSAIFKACTAGDIDTMKHLFQQKLASPHAINSTGEDLLIHALRAPFSIRYKACKFLLDIGCQGVATIALGCGPLDLVMALGSYYHTEEEALESDLNVMRLLVEIGRQEVTHSKIFKFGLALRSEISLSHVPPCLDYLCKQEIFDFSVYDVFTYCVVEYGGFIEYPPRMELSSFMRAFLACGGDAVTIVSDNGWTMVSCALWHSICMNFNDYKEQQEGFNSIVIAFCLLLRRGFNPYTNVGVPASLASDTAALDSDFTAVAWPLALTLNGWIPLKIGSGNESGSESGLSATSSDQDEVFSNHAPIALSVTNSDKGECSSNDGSSVSEDSELDQKIPGAWIDEEPEPDQSRNPEAPRKFRSCPANFDATVRNHTWDPSLYTILDEDTRRTLLSLRKEEEYPWTNHILGGSQNIRNYMRSGSP